MSVHQINQQASDVSRLTFVLPTVQRSPVGGYLIVYEHANRLAALGYDVTVVHPFGAHTPYPSFWRRQLAALLKHGDASLADLVPWMDINPDIAVRLVPTLRARHLPTSDVTVFTAWQTMEEVARDLPAHHLGRTAALVADYEFWAVGTQAQRRRIEQALRADIDIRMAISPAVGQMLAAAGVTTYALVPDGLDHDAFGCDVSPDERAPIVGFPLRQPPHKGVADALAARRLSWADHPEAAWECFGWARGIKVPPTVLARGRLTRAEQRAFYNRCSVFVLPSWAEGWGLPAAEAMACGAAVVTTRNGGTEFFAHDGVNAMQVPPHDPAALAQAVGRLLSDKALRVEISQEGIRTAQRLTYESSTQALIEAISTPAGR